jgi:peptidyl-tRNA hydrolase
VARIKEGDKLYLVTRSDLSPGQRAVQAAHAMRQFAHEHPDIDHEWFNNSNYLCLLEVPNESALHVLASTAREVGIRHAGFLEPDLSDQLTALALEPAARSLCKGLPLALQL